MSRLGFSDNFIPIDFIAPRFGGPIGKSGGRSGRRGSKVKRVTVPPDQLNCDDDNEGKGGEGGDREGGREGPSRGGGGGPCKLYHLSFVQSLYFMLFSTWRSLVDYVHRFLFSIYIVLWH